MARLVAYMVLVYLGTCCNILNADENHDNVSDTIQKPPYKSPEPSGFAYLAEHFDNEERFKNIWVLSEAKKDDIDEDIAKYDGKNTTTVSYLSYIFFYLLYIHLFYIDII